MAPLQNARHESFVRYLLEGKDATAAYEAAGFKRDDANAARLKANPKVRERLAELQTEIADKVPITIESLISELEEVRHAATGKNQFAAAVRAILGKAQLGGLLVEKQQVEVGGPGDFTKCNSVESVVEEMLRYQVSHYHDLRPEDHDHLAQLFAKCFEEAASYIETIKARPYTVSYVPKALPDRYGNGRSHP